MNPRRTSFGAENEAVCVEGRHQIPGQWLFSGLFFVSQGDCVTVLHNCLNCIRSFT